MEIELGGGSEAHPELYHRSGRLITPEEPADPDPAIKVYALGISPLDAPFDTTAIPSGMNRPLTAEEAAYYNALYPVEA